MGQIRSRVDVPTGRQDRDNLGGLILRIVRGNVFARLVLRVIASMGARRWRGTVNGVGINSGLLVGTKT